MTDLETAAGKQISRRTLLTSTGVGGVALLLSSTGLLRPDAARAASELHYGAAPERVQDVLDIFATNEAFGVTLVGTILDAAKKGSYSPALSEKTLRSLRAVRAEEQFHLDAQKRTGGRLRTDTFFLTDPHVLEDPHTLFTDLVELEDAAIASVMASFRTFTHAGRPDLVKQNFQFAAEESEHRLLANRNLGVRPANDQAFAPALYATVAEFYDALREKGIIGGSELGGGKKIVYPGPGAIDSSDVTYTTPAGPSVAANCARPSRRTHRR